MLGSRRTELEVFGAGLVERGDVRRSGFVHLERINADLCAILEVFLPGALVYLGAAL